MGLDSTTSDARALSPQVRDSLLQAQKNEITEYHIYQRLAAATKDPHNRDILEQIAIDERDHYDHWQQYTGQEVEPNRAKVNWYVTIARVLGLTFGIKLMEQGEEQAQVVYSQIAHQVPSAGDIVDDEDRHEHALIEMLDEERLRYVGSMVLGLNDALVELTGMLAGLTLALQNASLIGMTGLITGIAASLSMASSQYLSTRAEQEQARQDPLKAALYTGIAYIITVLLLITPYLLISNYLVALAITLVVALLIIYAFTFYISVAQGEPFRKRFLEMALISFGVAIASFFVGYLVRELLGVDV